MARRGSPIGPRNAPRTFGGAKGEPGCLFCRIDAVNQRAAESRARELRARTQNLGRVSVKATFYFRDPLDWAIRVLRQ